MAQQVEHVLGKDGVTGSNPVSSSIKKDFREEVLFCVLLICIAYRNVVGEPYRSSRRSMERMSVFSSISCDNSFAKKFCLV